MITWVIEPIGPNESTILKIDYEVLNPIPPDEKEVKNLVVVTSDDDFEFANNQDIDINQLILSIKKSTSY